MQKKQITLSLGLVLLLLVLVQMGYLGGQSRVAAASGEHSSHQTHGEAEGHQTGAHNTSEHQSHGEAGGHGGGHGEGHGGGHHAPKAKLLTPEVSGQAWLPLYLTFFSLFTAALIIVFRRDQRIRSVISVGTAVSSFGLILLMFEPVVTGVTIHGQLYKGISVILPLFPGFDATFKVDPAALLVAGVTVFLWILSTIHWLSYKNVEDPRKGVRYECLVLASLSMNMGVLMAGDFLTLFFFFEGMVIFPYSLIAHKEDPGAMAGANMYLRLGCATSLSLLFGMLLLQHYTGTVNITTLGPQINALVPGNVKYIMVALMVVGFGGKAGLFFEHAWLPNAHPVAPTPASCLLSGAMIKAGAYGIFRVCNMIIIPPDWGATLEWVTARHVGYVVIWVGIVTMFLGVLNALISSNSKRMLAYHSVSQMGYIVMGMGCAAYLGADGAMGLAGSMYHIVNHALFKASLFLTVGAVYYRTHELDMYKLGGLWRNMPFTCVCMFIAACGIAGIPGFNGFASKTLLHHSILEAYEHSAHYAADGLPDFKLRIAEIIFMITAGGTFASNMKLWVLDFLGPRQEKHKDIKPAPTSMKVSLGLVSASILFIGLNPNWMLEKIIGPALSYFHFNPASHPYHIIYNTHAAEGVRSSIPLLYNPISGAFLSDSAVVHNLLGGGDAVIFGGTVFILGMRFGWFHSEVPVWLSVVYYYRHIFHGFKRICKSVFEKLDAQYASLFDKVIFKGNIARAIALVVGEQQFWGPFNKLDGAYSGVVDKVILPRSIRKIIRGEKVEEGGIWPEFKKLDRRYDHLIDSLIFSDRLSSVMDKGGELSTAERQVWQEFTHLEEKYDQAFDKVIFPHGIQAMVNASEEESKVWKELTHLEKKYDQAFDKVIFPHGIQAMVNTSEEESKVWKELTHLEKKYDQAFDKVIFPHGVDVMIGAGEEESKVWKDLKELEEKYDQAFEKVIFPQGIDALIKDGDKEESRVWKDLKVLEEKYGKAFDKVFILRSLQNLAQQQGAKKETVSGFSQIMRIFGDFDNLVYNIKLDELVFGTADHQSEEPHESFFFKMSRNLSNIHSGDISHYISWIIIFLTIVVTILIGRLFIPTFLGLILQVTIILLTIIAAILFSKKKDGHEADKKEDGHATHA